MFTQRYKLWKSRLVPTSLYCGGLDFRCGASTKVDGENYKQINVW
jgi:hypothetical protein